MIKGKIKQICVLLLELMETHNDRHTIKKSPCNWNFTNSIFTIFWLEYILETGS